MRTGPKRKPIADVIAGGNYRPSRHGPKDGLTGQEDVDKSNPPTMPAWLTKEAQEVWLEELNRVTPSGTTDLDSTFFGNYCSLQAQVRAVLQAGNMPHGNQLTELRKMAELLGIAGAPSRAGRGKPAQAADDNEFAKLIGG